MIYFTSDEHYFHENIIRYCNRPFESAHEMNESFIANHNNTVSPEDTVYHLGDFGMSSRDNLQSILDRLNGTHHLVEGNHDDRRVLKLLGWSSVGKSMRLSLDSGIIIQLCHYPNGRDKYDNWDFYFYGHTHDRIQPNSNSIDVGVDSAYRHLGEYRPFSIVELAEIMENHSNT